MNFVQNDALTRKSNGENGYYFLEQLKLTTNARKENVLEWLKKSGIIDAEDKRKVYPDTNNWHQMLTNMG